MAQVPVFLRARGTGLVLAIGLVGLFGWGCGTGAATSTDPTTLPASVIDEGSDDYELLASEGDAPGKWEFEVKRRLGSPADALRFVWDFGDGGSYEGTSQIFQFPEEGTYIVTVSALDARDRVVFVLSLEIDVPTVNHTPVAVAEGVSADEGDSINLDGSASFDEDGDALTFMWTQVSGPPVTFLNDEGAVAMFVAPAVDADTRLVFTLTVSDGELIAETTVAVDVTDVFHIANVDEPECRYTITLEGGEEEDALDGVRPLTVVCTADIVSSEPLDDATLIWSFDGDQDAGSVGSHAAISRAFTTAGLHTVALTLTLGGVNVACHNPRTGDFDTPVTVWPSVTGKVEDGDGHPIASATVSASGGGTTAVSATDGSFALHVPYDWSGTVAVQHADYTFDDPDKILANVKTDTGIAFVAASTDGGGGGGGGGTTGGGDTTPECAVAGDCDDGAFCNGAESCVGGVCQAGSDPCPGQTCDEDTDACETAGCSGDAECDDGLYCNGVETCVDSACVAGAAVSCDDSIACTTDACNEANDACDHTPVNSACDNGSYCDGAETCDADLGCVTGAAVDCDDSIACTTDACNEATDTCDHTAVNAICDNGSYCDGVETCDVNLGCVGGANVDCDDGILCTTDACNEMNDSCDHTPLNEVCDNGLYCDGAETCDANLGCMAGGDPCPGEVCDEGSDTCEALVCDDAGDCDDGLYCNGIESCVDNTCIAGTAVVCNDGVACTVDSCNETTDSCTYAPVNAICDNGLYCDGVETCDADLGCVTGAAVSCDDSIACTTDACNEATDTCDHTAVNAICDNGSYCDGVETCDVNLGCVGGANVDCDDSILCTTDACNEMNDSCDHAPLNEVCDNGLYCDGAETCDANLGCMAGGDPCPGEVCDEGSDTCEALVCDDAGDCDDGLYCNGIESCVDNTCIAGTAVVCNDGVACTVDSCNETTDSCTYAPVNAICDNGLYCDGVETCDADLGCVTGAAVSCDDSIACTTDACNEATDTCDHTAVNAICDNGSYCDGVETCDVNLGCVGGANVDCDDGILCTTDACNEMNDSCDHTPLNEVCDNGLYCDGAETCDANLGCMAGGDPCPGEVCDEGSDTCEALVCDDAGDCDDGLYCNGIESCVDNTCIAGTAVVCNDGVACTVDSCNETTDSCTYAPVNAICDNGLYCDGVETCDADLGCVTGAAVSCDDSIACTTDACNEATDTCDHTAVNAICDNGSYCDGVETCDVNLGCVGGANVDCDDSILCTTDACNEMNDSCDHAPLNEVCDNGLYCDGAETCDANLGCMAGGDPCPGEVCDEGTDSCEAFVCDDDGDCSDGLYCTGVETCVDNTCVAGSDPCPGEVCDEGTDSCEAFVCDDDGDCSDGLYCNGIESCVDNTCIAGSDPCPGEVCDEGTDSCEAFVCDDDGDCSDGLYCTGVETCVDNTCVAGSDPCPGQTCVEATDSCQALGSGDTIYVHGASGDDGWSGLCETFDGDSCGPKETVQAAANIVEAGDTVLIKSGTYIAPNDNDATAVLRVVSSGTAEAPITFKAFVKPDGTWDEVILDGRGSGYNERVVHCIGQSHIIVEGLTAIRGEKLGFVFEDSHYITIRHCLARNNGVGRKDAGFDVRKQSSNILIEYCESYDNGTGIRIGIAHKQAGTQPDDVTVRNCLAYENIETGGDSDGVECSSITNSVFYRVVSYANSDDGFDWGRAGLTNVLVEECVAFGNNLQGIAGGNGNGFKVGQLSLYSPYPHHNMFRRNFSFGNATRGFDDGDSNFNEYYNNVAYGNGSWGWLVQEGNNATMYNNIMYGNDTSSPGGLSDDIACSSCTAENFVDFDYNLIGDSDDFGKVEDAGFNEHSLLDAPMFVDPPAPLVGDFETDIAALKSKVDLRLYLDPARRVVNPHFGEIPGFELVDPDSSCIDAGVDVGLPYNGAAPDMGACETE